MSISCQNVRFSTLKISVILISLIVLQQCDFSKTATLYKSQGASESCQNVCTSLSCFQNAAFYREIMKPSLDPCDDFYQFVCGNFMDNVNISKQANSINIFALAQSQISVKLYLMIKENVKPNDISAVRKLKNYYQNCIDETRMEADGTEPVLKILENIGGWPLLNGDDWDENDFDWIDTVYKIHNEKFPVFFPTISVTLDKDNSTKVLPKILTAATEIEKTFFLVDSGKKLKKAYFNFIVNIAATLGVDKDQIYEEVKDIFDFEINLYKIETEDSQKQSQEQTKMTLKELSKNYPSIPWLELLNHVFNPSGVIIDETEVVIIEDLEYITKLEKLIEITPKRVIANYLVWKVVQSSLGYMPSEFRVLEADYLNQVNGRTQTPDRASKCLTDVMKAFPIAVSAMYVRENFDQSIKDDVSEIVSNIKKQTKRNLEKISWMDDQTRKSAIEKLEAMGVTVGHADELMEDDKVDGYYKDLVINPGSYFHSAFNLSMFLQNENYKMLRKPLNLSDWTMRQSAVIINAYYMLQKNSIEIPAGFLQGTFFQRHRPQYLNYGAMGTIIGHEVTHAFDSNGRKFDKNGNLKNWWKSNTEKEFLKKAQCIIDQYSNFTVNQIQLHVNGDKTQSENIADNGGFKAAYLAYKEWAKTQRVSEGCLPALNYTPEQMFWISAASSWCSKHSSEYLKNLVTTDVHSPDMSRVIISFSNIKEFAEDFQCKPNSRMNPKEKCVLWLRCIRCPIKLNCGFIITVILLINYLALSVQSSQDISPMEVDYEDSSKMDIDDSSALDDICLTEGCYNAAQLIRNNINETADPCNNFFDFACGGFVSKAVVSDSKPATGYLHVVQEKVMKEVSELLQEIIDLTEPRIFELAKQYFKTCLDQTTLEFHPIFLKLGFNHQSIQIFYNFMVNVAVYLGAHRVRAAAELADVLTFEMQLANAASTTYSEPTNNFTIQNLETHIPIVSWLKYLNGLIEPAAHLEINDIVHVENPNYLNQLAFLMTTTRKRTIANYIIWRITYESIPHLNTPIPRWKECAALLVDKTKGIPVGVSSLYIRRFFNEETRRDVRDIVHAIGDEFKLVVLKLPWLDDAAKINAIKKSLFMKQIVGYPDQLKNNKMIEDYSRSLEIFSDHFLKNILNVQRFHYEHSMLGFKESIDKRAWLSFTDSTTINAYYYSVFNSFVLLAAFLQPPLFNHNWPTYVKYGSIGFIIGHETMHAYDAGIIFYDETGSFNPQLSRAHQMEYAKRITCYIQQYEQFKDDELGLHVDGKLTINENLADNVGIKVAYNAYKKWEQEHIVEEKLPGLNYTQEQIFWISSVNFLCSKDTPEYRMNLLLTEEHTPDKFRAQGHVSNLEEFAKAFNCPKNSPMNPTLKCNLS
ncbi:neprilysin-2 [Nasonia vitripennis]|uniref:Uncharacterized protein n=1 Tax=Nasonia vitripennis TaxID=7425 RepID=A0A7M7Q3R4_NASVI|nr:neprilysin-2 [Nasonia vitripennis]